MDPLFTHTSLWSKFNTPPVDLIQNPIQIDNLISHFYDFWTTKIVSSHTEGWKRSNSKTVNIFFDHKKVIFSSNDFYMKYVTDLGQNDHN